MKYINRFVEILECLIYFASFFSRNMFLKKLNLQYCPVFFVDHMVCQI